ncbi:hypothetical protein AB4Y32_12045 [Paraburkholderia phymatum]|uniref:Uncharacterized protein n=1 Tax=Paraburkholderia phymatum TaxID=148447 RepID=A0ACC6TYR4_9BURK
MRIDDGLRLVRPPADQEASDDYSQHRQHRPNAEILYERSLNGNLKRRGALGRMRDVAQRWIEFAASPMEVAQTLPIIL